MEMTYGVISQNTDQYKYDDSGIVNTYLSSYT